MSLESKGTFITVTSIEEGGQRTKLTDAHVPYHGAEALDFIIDTLSTNEKFKNLNYPLYNKYALEIDYNTNLTMPSSQPEKMNLNNIPYCKRMLIQAIIDEYNAALVQQEFSKTTLLKYDGVDSSMLLVVRDSKFKVCVYERSTGKCLNDPSPEYDCVENAAWYWVNVLERADAQQKQK